MKLHSFFPSFLLLASVTLPTTVHSQSPPSLLIYEIAGEDTGDYFGTCVNGIGDLDGDGYPDFAVGAPLAEAVGKPVSFDSGAVYLYSGLNGLLLAKVGGLQEDGHFGRYVSSAGDFNGDGVPDVIIGAPQENWPEIDPFKRNGAVYVLSGAWILNGTLPQYLGGSSPDGNPVLYGDGNNDKLGRSVCSMGDLDADGYSDVLIGAYEPHGSGAGYVTVLFGPDGVRRRTTSPTNQLWSFFGVSVSRVGDLNADGYDDAVVGAFGHDGDPLANGDSRGAAYIINGEWMVNGGQHPTIGQVFGISDDDQLGRYVSGIGDVDGDSIPDVLVGAHFEDPLTGGGPFDNRRAARIYSGASLALIDRVEGENPGDQFGNALCSFSDVDGDGVTDLLVSGSYGDYTKLYSGASRIPLRRFEHPEGPAAEANYGHSVRGIGFDPLGVAYLVIGAFGDDTAGDGAGRVWVHTVGE